MKVFELISEAAPNILRGFLSPQQESTVQNMRKYLGPKVVSTHMEANGPCVIITIGDNIMHADQQAYAPFDGWKKGTDYTFSVGYGDDTPNAVKIYNPLMFDDTKIVDFFELYGGLAPKGYR